MRYLVETLLYCIIQDKLNVPDSWRMNRFVRYLLILALLAFIIVFNILFIWNGMIRLEAGYSQGYGLIILPIALDLWAIFTMFDLYYAKYRSMLK